MINVIIVILLLVIVFFALKGAKKRLKKGCCGGGKPIKIKPKDKNASNYAYKFTVYIDGMTCENCKIRVENAFNSVDGCMAKVALKRKSAVVCCKQNLSDEEIRKITEKCGYTFVKYVRN